MAWLDEARSRLRVGINIDASSADGVEFSFDVRNVVLRGWVGGDGRHGEIAVEADWAGQSWDFLLNLEASISAAPSGFLCMLCEPDAHRVFPTMEALWRDHLFDPFEEWVNTKLAPARAVALFRLDGSHGTTWVRLIPKGEAANSAAFLIAL